MPAQVLEAQAVFDLDRLRQRSGGDRPLGDPPRRGQILLHQHRRDGEDVADVVEAFAGVVGREIPVGAEIDGEQITDGVGVLRPVQPTGRDPSGVRLHRRIGADELLSSSLTSVVICSSDGGTDASSGGISRLLSFERIISQRSRSACEGLDRLVQRDVEASGRIAGVVAFAAGVVEQRFRRGGEGRFGRRPRDGATRRSRRRRRGSRSR